MTHSWTVAEQLRWVAARRPAATAIVDADGELTFAQFHQRVQALAGYLAPHAGSRVGLYLANRREWAEAFFACQLAGIGVVPINDRYQDREVRHLVEDAGITLLVSDAAGQRGDVLAGLGGDVDVLLVGDRYEAALAEGGPVRPFRNEESAVLYTSGTTALPKGVRLSQANQALGTFLGPAVLLGLTAADTVLISTPLGHRVGQVRLLGGLLTGGRTVLSADARPATLLEAVQRHGVTVTGMVPTIARDLAFSGSPLAERLGGLRVLSVTGEAMTGELRETLARLLPGTELWTFFASTETGMATALPPEEFTSRPGSSGRALPGVEVAVADLEAGIRSSAGSGEVLVRSGPPGSYAVGAGYVGAAAASPFTDADGWFATGDIGTLDEDGWLSITGRSKDMILSGGFNIAAQEVEEVLRQHPGVRDVAVTGEPDERFGERVVAWVVRTPGDGDRLDGEELRTFTGTQMAAFKRPRVVRFVDELPRTATGKIAKWRLAADAGSGR